MSRLRSLMTQGLAVLVSFSFAFADEGSTHAKLTGLEEVPPVSSAGSGDFEVEFSSGNSIQYTLSYSGLKGTASVVDLVFGQRRVNGGTIAILCGGDKAAACPPSGQLTGVLTAMDVLGPASQGIASGDLPAVLDAIRSGQTYVNAHSTKFPAGEIRGQIGEAASGISGKIWLGPTCPVAHPGDDQCKDQPYETKMVIQTEDGSKEVKRFKSNSEGGFRVALLPGIYRLESEKKDGASYPFLKPITVVVEAHKFTLIDIVFDTGIR